MRINKTTGHAIRIMLACAREEGRLVKAAELSVELGIGLQNVLKIVHLLSHANLVAATRGRNGGVRLAAPATNISIAAVVRAIETMDVDDDGSANVATNHPDLAPNVAGLLDDALLAFISVLEKHSLAEIAAMQSRKPKLRPAKRNSSPRAGRRRAASAPAVARPRKRGRAPARSSELE